MKVDWKARMVSPYFWIGIFGVIMTALGVTPELFTSWDAVITQGKALFGNPYLLGSMIAAVIGVTANHGAKEK